MVGAFGKDSVRAYPTSASISVSNGSHRWVIKRVIREGEEFWRVYEKERKSVNHETVITFKTHEEACDEVFERVALFNMQEALE